jgi:hypothetical protein
MASPIYVSPNSAKWTLSQEQSTKLLAALQANRDITNKNLGVTVGSFTGENIDFSYTYEAGVSQLTLTIVAKHGLHKFAPNDTIFDNVNELINQSIA